jgi:hypothetical protein
MLKTWGLLALGLATLVLAGPAAAAQGAYPAMAPLDQYKASDEAALARSAAPPSISGEAEILVLGAHGYGTAAKGKNGFVCIVERGWANEFASPDFWNPKIRGPICFNPASARSVLPTYLMRTEWVLAGLGKAQILERTKAAIAAGKVAAPAPGAMCYMMSKDGFLDDTAGHWRPHLMFFTPRMPAAAWGANMKGSPVGGGDNGDIDPATVFLVPVGAWSDGSPAPPMHM